MNDESLESLLRQVGRDPGPPPEPRPDLADRVRRLATRRRRRRRLTMVSAAGVLLFAAVLWPQFHAGDPAEKTERVVGDRTNPAETESLPPEEIERLLAEVARLDAEVEHRQQAVQWMLEGERIHAELQETTRHWGQPDELQLARAEVEKTAFLLVAHAEQQTLSAAGDEAARQFEQVARRFPHTKAAATARRKLDERVIEKGTL